MGHWATAEDALTDIASRHRALSPEAIRGAFDQALNEFPTARDLWHQSGLVWVQLGDFHRAEHDLQQALTIGPPNGSIHNHLGNLYRMGGHFQKAIQHYEAALHFQASFFEAHNNLGNIFYRQKDFNKAKQHYSEAIRINPDYGDAHYNLGNLYSHSEQIDEAITHFSAATRCGGHPNASFNLGLCLRETGQRQQATQCLWAYCDAVPEDGMGWYYLALVYSELNRDEEALEHYQKALELMPDHKESHHNLGAIYHKLGDHVRALSHYRNALKIDPTNVSAQFMINALSEATTPEGAPNPYIEFLFDQYAPYYEVHLREQLCYQGPELLKSALAHHLDLDASEGRHLLDLGCGTGLCGKVFEHTAQFIHGIDLSSSMIAQAKGRGVYDELHTADILDYCARHEGKYDLVLAADVLIYFGDLLIFLKTIRTTLKQTGIFAFTLEKQDSETPYILQKTGRYAHSKGYIQQAIVDADLELLSLDTVTTRLHHEKPLFSWRVVVKR